MKRSLCDIHAKTLEVDIDERDIDKIRSGFRPGTTSLVRDETRLLSPVKLNKRGGRKKSCRLSSWSPSHSILSDGSDSSRSHSPSCSYFNKFKPDTFMKSVRSVLSNSNNLWEVLFFYDNILTGITSSTNGLALLLALLDLPRPIDFKVLLTLVPTDGTKKQI